MSDTPRTDAVVAPYIGSDSVTVEECSALLDEARQLERELAAANARISQLANVLEFVVPFCPYLHHPKRYQHKAGDPCPVEEIIRKAKQTQP
jgi:hypothetical protein